MGRCRHAAAHITIVVIICLSDFAMRSEGLLVHLSKSLVKLTSFAHLNIFPKALCRNAIRLLSSCAVSTVYIGTKAAFSPRPNSVWNPNCCAPNLIKGVFSKSRRSKGCGICRSCHVPRRCAVETCVWRGRASVVASEGRSGALLKGSWD